MFAKNGNLRSVLLKHLLGLEPECSEPLASDWERLRAQAVAEFLPELESPRLTQQHLAALETPCRTGSRLSFAREF